VHEVGGRGWSISIGPDLLLAHALGVRSVADLPVYDRWVPEPLDPEPPSMSVSLSRDARAAAAAQWRAWWRILWAQGVVQHRQSAVLPEPPLFGLDVMFEPDPPNFRSLAPTPELRQVVASSWESLSSWLDLVHDEIARPRGEEGDPEWAEWAPHLIERADGLARRPIADVAVHLGVLPVAGQWHWLVTEDADQHVIHALVASAFITEPWGYDDWLLDALVRSG
jgi:hypothetical protein